MHKKILKDATDEQDYEIEMIKETNHELYETLETYLYKKVYGPHFNEWLLEKATKSMLNEDDSVGAHWTVEQTNQVARNLGVTFERFNEYDFNYVMNMMYSDYYGAVSNDANTYAKMARKFLEDKDGYEGKAFCYYMKMKS